MLIEKPTNAILNLTVSILNITEVTFRFKRLSVHCQNRNQPRKNVFEPILATSMFVKDVGDRLCW